MQAVTGYEATSGISSTANAQQQQQQQQQAESSPSRPLSSGIPRSSTLKFLPEAWVYYVVTSVEGVYVPLAAMHRLGRSTDFLRDAVSVCSILTDGKNREMLELEKDLAEDYYKHMKTAIRRSAWIT
ncbi:hypothetical protein NLG97_g11220 [Lecanicillium saksenae]|uniref:Uncharacterized protein n=1 Tax=Lecanicillium saksenae TaxID=468837 RepID=A0ACC1QDE1_9HYPO|nr:hypothetical protein NLG97_g11220 [Lecanicillium saksenae]